MLSAAILVGGRAHRFGGRDKGALILDGRSILDRQLAELAGLAGDIMLVGAHESLDSRALHAREGAGVRLVADRVPGRGPLGGLDAALAEAHYDTLVVVACDMPFVTRVLLAHLASLAIGVDAVVPYTDRRPHPLCAVYSYACRVAVTRCLSDGRLAMQDLLEDVRVRRVNGGELESFGEPDRLLANVNTADEYAALTRRIGNSSTVRDWLSARRRR